MRSIARRVLGLAIASCAAACSEPAATPLDAGGDAGRAVDAGPFDAGRDAGPTDAPTKGPIVLRVTTTSALVRWESRLAPAMAALDVTPESGGATDTVVGTTRVTEVQLSYGVGNPLVREPDVPGTYHVSEVALEGLTPATCYRYTVVGHPMESGRLCTMHEATDTTTPIVFYAIGDTSPAIMGTLRVLSSADPADAEFSVHVGDIQYYSTLIESQAAWFRLMQPMLRANAFLPCIGNHEDEEPHEFDDIYLRLFGGAGVDGNDLWYHYETGGVHFFSLSSEHDLDIGSEQHDWLLATLDRVEAEPTHRFSVLYLHRPVYTLGDYRARMNQRDAILEATRGRRVPLVLAGHMHGYERFEVGDTTFVTTGAGGFVDSSIDQQVMERPAEAMLRVASGRFLQAMFVELVREGGTDRVRGRVLDDVGVVRDSFERVVTP